MTDWAAWHRPYEDPDSSLSRRLGYVQGFLRDALDLAPPGPIRLVSLCAGQARDVLGVLADHPRAGEVSGRVIEWDPRNVAWAVASAEQLGVADQLEIVEGDASVTDCCVGAVPADVVLACGIFGNITDDDIRTTVSGLRMLCAPGATVLWTRHRARGDLTPTIRQWFTDDGYTEVGFASDPDATFGVGANRLAIDPPPFEPGIKLFTFVGDGTLRQR